MSGALEWGLPQLALRQFASAKCPLWIKALAEVANGCNARWPVLPPCPGQSLGAKGRYFPGPEARPLERRCALSGPVLYLRELRRPKATAPARGRAEAVRGFAARWRAPDCSQGGPDSEVSLIWFDRPHQARRFAPAGFFNWMGRLPLSRCRLMLQRESWHRSV
jgi:hypothetical protein